MNVKVNETCYWILRANKNTWIGEFSSLTLQIDKIEGGTLFVLTG